MRAAEDRWYAAGTHAGCGRLAMHHLARQGFVAYSPFGEESRIEKGKLVSKQLQLFPGYIFVNIDVSRDRWVAVNNTVGVTHLLPVNEMYPTPLPCGFVEDLQSLQAGGGFDSVRAECIAHMYSIGDKAEVTAGPWSGHTGEFVKYHKGSLVLLMALLGKKLALGFHPNTVVPAGRESVLSVGAVA